MLLQAVFHAVETSRVRRQELETQLQRQHEEEDKRNVEVLGRFKVRSTSVATVPFLTSARSMNLACTGRVRLNSQVAGTGA